MTFLENFMSRLKEELEKDLESRVYLYRFTLAEKKLDDLVSYGKINFISIYPVYFEARELISETQYRGFIGKVKLDFYYVYNYNDESESNFLKLLQIIIQDIHKCAIDNSYIVKGNIAFSLDVALISNIITHYATTEIEIRSFELPDQLYIESLGQISYKEV